MEVKLFKEIPLALPKLSACLSEIDVNPSNVRFFLALLRLLACSSVISVKPFRRRESTFELPSVSACLSVRIPVALTCLMTSSRVCSASSEPHPASSTAIQQIASNFEILFMGVFCL